MKYHKANAPWWRSGGLDGGTLSVALSVASTVEQLLSMTRNLLDSYRTGQLPAAGNYPRVKDLASMATLLQDSGNQYGASQAAYTSWKRSGFPTAEHMPTTAFGLSTRRGETAGDALNHAAAPELPPNFARPPAGRSSAPRVNPITWQGGEEPVLHARPQMQLAAPRAAGPAQQEPPQPPLISEEQMHTTWSELLRSRKLPQSAAQCMVGHLPDAHSIEPNPEPGPHP